MKICALVDEMGTGLSTPEEEYEEIKADLCGWLELDPEKVTFRPRVYPHQLGNESVDIYVMDFGGMLPGCEDGIISHFRSLLEQIKGKPNTLFIIWSRFTQRWYEEVVAEYAPEFKVPNVAIYSDIDILIPLILRWFGLEEKALAFENPEPRKALIAPDGFGTDLGEW